MKGILSLIDKEEVQDILNIGYIDDDDKIKSFVPSLNTFFIEFETKYLHIHKKQIEYRRNATKPLIYP